MANLNITDLFIEGDFFEQLTKEELELDVYGGAAGAGSVSAARYSQRGDVVDETAVTATVATSDRRPFKINLSYSFEPRLSAAAGVSFR
jgi:hypothetical protein